MRRVIQLIVLIAVLFFAGKAVFPWVQRHRSEALLRQIIAKGGCPAMAAHAVQNWNNGLKRFVKPPYDLADWTAFYSNIESDISQAQSNCWGNSDSGMDARLALGELHSLTSEVDAEVRNGMPLPSDIAGKMHMIEVDLGESVGLRHRFKI